jgi:hypothetical protein
MARAVPEWVVIFLTGLVMWSATVLVIFTTRNANLIPAVILVGSFLIPVMFVAYAFGRADQVITAQRIFTAFVYGGLLGVLGVDRGSLPGRPTRLRDHRQLVREPYPRRPRMGRAGQGRAVSAQRAPSPPSTCTRRARPCRP